jgi:hypothetical protein
MKSCAGSLSRGGASAKAACQTVEVHPFRTSRRATVTLAVALAIMQAVAHEEQVILVGRNAAGEIIVDSDFAQPVELPASIFPGISGYATGELAFHSAIVDDPTNDFFQLSSEASFRFVLLAKDPGVEVWNDTGSDYMAINDTYRIGASPFDNHPVWNIVSGTVGSTYSLRLKLQDVNGLYPDSTPFALRFTPMENPAGFLITIVQVDPDHAELTWTTNAADWQLQSAARLTAAIWETVTNAPVIVGSHFSLGITTTDTQCFFRLKQK